MQGINEDRPVESLGHFVEYGRNSRGSEDVFSSIASL